MSASADAAISMVGIIKRFPGVQALKNVSIEIKPGEVVGLIGENGAGKSTLMKILSGVYQPDAGQIFIAGKGNPHRKRGGRQPQRNRNGVPGAIPAPQPDDRRKHLPRE